MARTKKAESSDSLDSLLDALTNVVAVLVVVLLLLQLDVERSVDQLYDSLTPATPEQIEEAKAKLAEAEKDLKAKIAMLEAPAPAPEQLAELRANLELLEKSVEEHKARLLDVEKLRAMLTAAETEAAAEKAETDARLARIQELRALLDQTPRQTVQESAVVSIPDSRPLPEDANLFYCYVIGRKTYFVDPEAVKKTAMAEFEKKRRSFPAERVRERGERARVVYGQKEVVEYFASLKMQIRDMPVTVPYNKPGTTLSAVVAFDPAKGDASFEEMDAPDGRFQRFLRELKKRPRAVLLFKVNTNGFATYLKAREIADNLDLPCGWEVDNATQFSIPLDFEVTRLETPPPAPPPPPPSNLPPPPGRTLD